MTQKTETIRISKEAYDQLTEIQHTCKRRAIGDAVDIVVAFWMERHTTVEPSGPGDAVRGPEVPEPEGAARGPGALALSSLDESTRAMVLIEERMRGGRQ